MMIAFIFFAFILQFGVIVFLLRQQNEEAKERQGLVDKLVTALESRPVFMPTNPQEPSKTISEYDYLQMLEDRDSTVADVEGADG